MSDDADKLAIEECGGDTSDGKGKAFLICKLCHSEFTDFKEHVKSLVHIDARDTQVNPKPPAKHKADSAEDETDHKRPKNVKDDATKENSVSEKNNGSAENATGTGVGPKEILDEGKKDDAYVKDVTKRQATFLLKHWHCSMCVHVHRLEDETFEEHARNDNHQVADAARLTAMKRDWAWRKSRRWVYTCSACRYHTNDKPSFLTHIQSEHHDSTVETVLAAVHKQAKGNAEKEGTGSTENPPQKENGKSIASSEAKQPEQSNTSSENSATNQDSNAKQGSNASGKPAVQNNGPPKTNKEQTAQKSSAAGPPQKTPLKKGPPQKTPLNKGPSQKTPLNKGPPQKTSANKGLPGKKSGPGAKFPPGGKILPGNRAGPGNKTAPFRRISPGRINAAGKKTNFGKMPQRGGRGPPNATAHKGATRNNSPRMFPNSMNLSRTFPNSFSTNSAIPSQPFSRNSNLGNLNQNRVWASNSPPRIRNPSGQSGVPGDFRSQFRDDLNRDDRLSHPDAGLRHSLGYVDGRSNYPESQRDPSPLGFRRESSRSFQTSDRYDSSWFGRRSPLCHSPGAMDVGPSRYGSMDLDHPSRQFNSVVTSGLMSPPRQTSSPRIPMDPVSSSFRFRDLPSNSPHRSLDEPSASSRSRHNFDRNEPSTDYPNSRRNEYPDSRVNDYPGSRMDDYLGSRIDDYPGSRMDDYPGSRMNDYPGSRMDDYPGSRMDDYPGSRMDDYPGSRMDDYRGSRRDVYPDSRMNDYPSRMDRSAQSSLFSRR